MATMLTLGTSTGAAKHVAEAEERIEADAAGGPLALVEQAQANLADAGFRARFTA
jgi:hypothetical protein